MVVTGVAVAAVVVSPVIKGGPLSGSPANAAVGVLPTPTVSSARDTRGPTRSAVPVDGIVRRAMSARDVSAKVASARDAADPFGRAPEPLPAHGSTATGEAASLSSSGIPDVALAAYRAAEAALEIADPTCRLDWPLLAGIGRVESDHGRHAGSVLTASGRSIPAIIGIRLDGSVPGTAVIRDTDGGRLDGDPDYDRAVGPMQFLPGSWERFATDGDGDGVRDPQDIDDAALAAAAYLCSGPDDLSTPEGAGKALRRYNNSAEYVAQVLRLAQAYRLQTTPAVVPVVAAPGPVPGRPSAPTPPAAPSGMGVAPAPTPAVTPSHASAPSSPAVRPDEQPPVEQPPVEQPPVEHVGEQPPGEPPPVEGVGEQPLGEPLPVEGVGEQPPGEPPPVEGVGEQPPGEPPPVEGVGEQPTSAPASPDDLGASMPPAASTAEGSSEPGAPPQPGPDPAARSASDLPPSGGVTP